RAAALDVEGLVDRLVRDMHGLIIGEVHAQAARDLLRAPRGSPPAVSPAPVPPTLPRLHVRDSGRFTVRPDDPAVQPILHILSQQVVRGELGGLGPLGPAVRAPPRSRGPVVELAAPAGGVAPQLPRDRRWRAAQPAGDLTNPRPPGPHQRDLLPLIQRQVPTRQRHATDISHPASLTEPPRSNRLRHAHAQRRLLAGDTLGDQPPERPPLLPAPRGRSARRTHRRPASNLRRPALRPPHAHLPGRGVATTS